MRSRLFAVAVACSGLSCSPASPPPERATPALVVMTAAARETASATVTPAPEPPPDRVSVELFVMSRCPYASRVEVTWAEVVKRLGNVDLRVSFIGTIGPSGELGSMRGPSELTGDAAQICAMKYSPKWLDMIACQNRAISDADFNWRECAADLGMPLEAIEACAFGSEAKSLLAESFTYSSSRSANASPTMIIGNQPYNGGRSLKELMSAVCQASRTKPEACNGLDSAPEVPVTAIVDRRCTACDTPRAENDALASILNPKLKVLDYQSPEGRPLFDSVRRDALPLYVFDKGEIVEDGAWNPRCADAGGCNLPRCKAAPSCRPNKPKQIDVYLESSSPLNTPAIFALSEVLQSFEQRGSPLSFALHQLDVNPKRKAPNEPSEAAAEAVRRACVQKLAPGKPLLRYLSCRAAQPDAPWRSCTGQKTDLATAAIAKCAEGSEGAKLLAASRKESREAAITSGSTFVVNGRATLRTIHAEALKRAVCSANPKLAGCDATLGERLVK